MCWIHNKSNTEKFDQHKQHENHYEKNALYESLNICDYYVVFFRSRSESFLIRFNRTFFSYMELWENIRMLNFLCVTLVEKETFSFYCCLYVSERNHEIIKNMSIINLQTNLHLVTRELDHLLLLLKPNSTIPNNTAFWKSGNVLQLTFNYKSKLSNSNYNF